MTFGQDYRNQRFSSLTAIDRLNAGGLLRPELWRRLDRVVAMPHQPRQVDHACPAVHEVRHFQPFAIHDQRDL